LLIRCGCLSIRTGYVSRISNATLLCRWTNGTDNTLAGCECRGVTAWERDTALHSNCREPIGLDFDHLADDRISIDYESNRACR
jgi:hypothetical protein